MGGKEKKGRARRPSPAPARAGPGPRGAADAESMGRGRRQMRVAAAAGLEKGASGAAARPLGGGANGIRSPLPDRGGPTTTPQPMAHWGRRSLYLAFRGVGGRLGGGRERGGAPKAVRGKGGRGPPPPPPPLLTPRPLVRIRFAPGLGPGGRCWGGWDPAHAMPKPRQSSGECPGGGERGRVGRCAGLPSGGAGEGSKKEGGGGHGNGGVRWFSLLALQGSPWAAPRRFRPVGTGPWHATAVHPGPAGYPVSGLGIG